MILQNNQEAPGQRFVNYLIVIGIFIPLNPFFATAISQILIFLLIFTFIVANQRRVKLIDQKIAGILLFVYFLIGIQGSVFSGFSAAAIYKPILTFYIPFLLYRLMGVAFFKYYVRILFVIALITTPFWALQSFSESFALFIREAIDWAFPLGWNVVPRSILIYTAAWRDEMFNTSLGFYRNSGMFHEPGGYGVLLNLGIIANYSLTGKMFNRRNLLFIFCLLTTLSTAGYVTLFVILASYLVQLKINVLFKVLTIFIFVFISYQAYVGEEFLQAKIETQFESQSIAADQNFGEYKAQSGRFFAFLTAFDLFLDHPFFGRGIIYASSEKALGEMHEESSYGYGFIGVLSMFGVFFGLYFIIMFFRGIRDIAGVSGRSKLFIWSAFIAINLALLTQVFIMTTIFVLIFIIGVFSKKLNYKEH